VEYLRWLHNQSRLFLRPAYTQTDIAELPDSDDDNELADVYDEMTRGGTVEPERGPFQNYVVSIFSGLLICTGFPVLSFVIVTTIVQATQLGQFANEATDALSHPPNTIASHSMLRAFVEVSMVSSSVLHRTISLNSLISRIFLCRGSARVLDGWRFVVTVSDLLICPSPSHHRLMQQPLHHVVPAEEGRV
jgi:hypothetical protein